MLFNWGYSNFEEATPAQAGATLATAKMLYGVAPDVAAGVAQSWTLVIPKGQGAAVKTSISLNPGLEAPISKGAVIGKIVATANGKQLGEAPVVALAGVERAGFFAAHAPAHLRLVLEVARMRDHVNAAAREAVVGDGSSWPAAHGRNRESIGTP